jgi:argininosuccinate lyase
LSVLENAQSSSPQSRIVPEWTKPAQLNRTSAGPIRAESAAIASRSVRSTPVATMTFDVEAMRAACDAEGLYATDLAEALVRSGVPFREAHRRTGELLKRVDEEGRTLADLTDDEWERFGVPGGSEMLDPDRSVRARTTAGGPSPDSVHAQADALARTVSASALLS